MTNTFSRNYNAVKEIIYSPLSLKHAEPFAFSMSQDRFVLRNLRLISIETIQRWWISINTTKVLSVNNKLQFFTEFQEKSIVNICGLSNHRNSKAKLIRTRNQWQVKVSPQKPQIDARKAALIRNRCFLLAPSLDIKLTNQFHWIGRSMNA